MTLKNYVNDNKLPPNYYLSQKSKLKTLFGDEIITLNEGNTAKIPQGRAFGNNPFSKIQFWGTTHFSKYSFWQQSIFQNRFCSFTPELHT